ncbi:hypothetical protein [Natrinema sp. CBA1119]|nr:hypothetical protein [Natrinema sp. CBA1119]
MADRGTQLEADAVPRPHSSVKKRCVCASGFGFAAIVHTPIHYTSIH